MTDLQKQFADLHQQFADLQKQNSELLKRDNQREAQLTDLQVELDLVRKKYPRDDVVPPNTPLTVSERAKKELDSMNIQFPGTRKETVFQRLNQCSQGKGNTLTKGGLNWSSFRKIVDETGKYKKYTDFFLKIKDKWKTDDTPQGVRGLLPGYATEFLENFSRFVDGLPSSSSISQEVEEEEHMTAPSRPASSLRSPLPPPPPAPEKSFF
jgi:hypothetical protein